MSNSGANFESIGGLPEYSGTVGSKTVRRIKGGINSWIKDNGGMPLEAFGAKWNGTTDDSAALTEALEASAELSKAQGCPILLPYGTGIINGTPKVPKNLESQIAIRGSSMRGTTVKMTEALQFLNFANTSKGDTIGNINVSEFTIDGNEQVASGGTEIPVVFGPGVSSKEQINFVNARARRIRTINVPNLDKPEGGRRSILVTTFHKEPALTLNNIENIDIRECEFGGSQYGVLIGALAGHALPINVKLSNIYVGDIKHRIAELPTETEGFNAHVQLGQYGWTDGKTPIVVERIYGENSGDIGIELDIPCTIRDCWMNNDNNGAYLFNTFNCATTKEPIVTTLNGAATIGTTNLKVSSSAAFTSGEIVTIFGTESNGVGTSETRTIKALPDSEHIEVSEGISVEHKSGVWLQQVDDMNAVQWKGYNLKHTRTATMPGANHSLIIQNTENVRPCPEIDIDGYTYYRNVEDLPVNQGEVIAAQCGTATSPAGNPKALRIKKLKVDIRGLKNSGSETKSFWPIYGVMRGAGCPIEIQGEINIEGAGVTSTGKISGHTVDFRFTSGLFDLDIITKTVVGSTGGEAWKNICINQESTTGDASGKFRHRARASSIKSGGGTFTGVRFGKACGFASQSITTTLNTATLAAGQTVIPVKSTAGFKGGEAIVIDALSTTKSEIANIASLVENTSLTIVSLGATPGTVNEHVEGAVIAPLKYLIVADSDWFGLGNESTGIAFEDANVAIRTITRGNVYPAPSGSTAVTFPGSTKIFQIIQKGLSGTLAVESGTVTAIEWSSNGVGFVKAASATGGIVHVSTGDFMKVTDSVEPTITFQADRN